MVVLGWGRLRRPVHTVAGIRVSSCGYQALPLAGIRPQIKLDSPLANGTQLFSNHRDGNIAYKRM
jgi:hypothetical protein